MDRKGFESLVLEKYGIKGDYPFEDDFETAVFRHNMNKKWFAIAMNISRSRLGLVGNDIISVVNFKCKPEIIESIVGVEQGIYKAYHMNKAHWLTVALDGSCDSDTIEWLLEISFDLTNSKKRRLGKND